MSVYSSLSVVFLSVCHWRTGLTLNGIPSSQHRAEMKRRGNYYVRTALLYSRRSGNTRLTIARSNYYGCELKTRSSELCATFRGRGTSRHRWLVILMSTLKKWYEHFANWRLSLPEILGIINCRWITSKNIIGPADLTPFAYQPTPRRQNTGSDLYVVAEYIYLLGLHVLTSMAYTQRS